MGIAYILGGRAYDFLDEYFEKNRYAKIRKELLKNVKNNILDAGCGTGRNFPHYNEKARVIGVDLSPRMLEVAKERIKESTAKITVQQGDLRNLKFPNNKFDFIMASFVLCVMPQKDEEKALKELIRVAKPGARMYFLEYVYSKSKRRRMVMKLTSFIPKLLYSIRFNATLPVIQKEKGIKIEKLQFLHDDVLRLIVVRKSK